MLFVAVIENVRKIDLGAKYEEFEHFIIQELYVKHYNTIRTCASFPCQDI